MSRAPALPLALLLACTLVPTAHAQTQGGAVYRIVLARRALAAGEQVELRLVPPPPPSARVTWQATVGSTSRALGGPSYRAPYVIAHQAPAVVLAAAVSAGGTRTETSTTVEITPGAVAGAADCLGPDQSFSTVVAGLEPEYTPADELPEVVTSVEPEFPRSALARGVARTITVRALVCRTGRVLDAWSPPVYRAPGDTEPIALDPKLVEAALAAVRQYVFAPARVAGEAVAVWVDVPIAFRP